MENSHKLGVKKRKEWELREKFVKKGQTNFKSMVFLM